MVAAGQEVLAALLLQAHRVGEDPQGEGLRECGDGVELGVAHHPVDEVPGVIGPLLAQSAQRPRPRSATARPAPPATWSREDSSPRATCSRICGFASMVRRTRVMMSRTSSSRTLSTA
ncbi:hypothetical protein [Nocardiopsis sp. LOL_012]|uniref:hypothetical protein n=1 Tax=Nocardiopsis sp. LOL_012 TaxID=3345409 RepID=UPI003A8BACF6